MLETILAENALPNLHPAVVHFPLALLVTALIFDLACVVTRAWPWMDRAATALWVLGTAGLGGAYLTGDAASDQMVGITGEAQAVLADHEALAELSLFAFGGVMVLRLLVSWLGRRDKRIHIGLFRLVALAAALAAQLLLVATADRGGALVYRYGMGVEAAGWEAPPPDPD
jgi:uncharacterized membrane protein